MYQINWLPEARDDLERLYDFLQPHSKTAAQKAIMTLIQAVDTLKDFPEKGRPWPADRNFRELSVRFSAKGYSIRYRIHENTILIVRIWHMLAEQ
ncbi:MAG: type II toxin-antitoxin system RelE/ParE family toxin [Sneathiellales bacterium]|nr:type II toxin-antitoxin system RelE/ParE family toxin [Sneathiellales bacterium]